MARDPRWFYLLPLPVPSTRLLVVFPASSLDLAGWQLLSPPLRLAHPLLLAIGRRLRSPDRFLVGAAPYWHPCGQDPPFRVAYLTPFRTILPVRLSFARSRFCDRKTSTSYW